MTYTETVGKIQTARDEAVIADTADVWLGITWTWVLRLGGFLAKDGERGVKEENRQKVKGGTT